MALLLPQNPTTKHRESVFASVFPVSSVVHTTPTPGATPEVGVGAGAGAGAGFLTPSQPYGYNNNDNDNNNYNNNIVNADTSIFGKTFSSGGGGSISNTSSSNAPFVDALPEQQQQQQQQQQHQQQSPQARADIDQIAARIIKRDAAWSTATRFLSFPRRERQPRRRSGDDDDLTEALAYLLDAGAGAGDGHSLRKGFDMTLKGSGMEQDIVEWYIAEVRRDFKDEENKSITALWDSSVPCDSAARTLEQSITLMQYMQRKYYQPVADDILPVIRMISERQPESASMNTAMEARIERLTLRLQRDIQGIIIYSLPLHLLSKTISFFLYDRACKLFDLDVLTEEGDDKMEINSRDHVVELQRQLQAICRGLRSVGYPQARAERALADAVDKLIDKYITSQYMEVDWQGQSAVTTRLRMWIADGLAPFAENVLKLFSADKQTRPAQGTSNAQLEPYQIDMWKQLAVWRLGKLRVKDLFDYILKWNQSLGAVRDLKEFIVTPAARSYLVQSFTFQLARRLLQPAVPTLNILNFYIYAIRLFNDLDPKGVLLDRISKPLRRYLKERNDTARIVIASLLTDVKEMKNDKPNPVGEISEEIALEMRQPALPNLHEFDHDLDWADMNWSPEPVDAEPEYRRSKSDDVTASLLSLYDRDDFIAELKSIFGEHLLSIISSEYKKEINLLDLIKARLGDDKLQACEVMLRDIVDSKTINEEIERRLPSGDEEDVHTDVLVQILSRFFWPALHEENFLVPKSIFHQLSDFTEVFMAMKKLRGLEFLPALGRVIVNLELEDRNIELEVLPAQASVICAFQDTDINEGFQSIGGEADNAKARSQIEQQKPTSIVAHPIRRSVQELVDALEMDESLVRTSVAFWVGKMILRQIDTDVFQVMERLEGTQIERSGIGSSDAAAAAEASAVAATAASSSAVKSQEDLLLENMTLYSQFVIGMLTNQGSMPPAKIVMMLKMFVPGGFPYGSDEIKALLQRLADEGKLVNSGGIYSVKPADA